MLGEFDFAEFGPPPQVWIPFQIRPNTTDQGHYFQAAGRLKPGVTLEQAKARLEASAEEYKRKYPNALGPNGGFSVEPLRDVLVRNVRPSLLVLAGAVSFVLLIACANVANLLLVRATGRRREIAIRAAIGGSRGRIVRQLLTESVVLSLAGGVLGLVLGMVGIRALLAVNTAGLPRVGEDGALVGLDWRVAGFTFLVSLGTGILFGLIPALQSSRTDLTTTLKESSGRSGTGFRQNKARSILVVTEVALALVLLIGSALLIRTAVALARVDPGFDAQQRADDADVADRAALPERRGRRAAGPQRRRAAAGASGRRRRQRHLLRAAQGGYGLPFIIVGRPLQGPGPFHGGGGWMTVSPRLLRGVQDSRSSAAARSTSATTAARPPVVIINEAMARQFWPTGRSAERAADHRPRRHARVRRASPSARSSASSATRATAG